MNAPRSIATLLLNGVSILGIFLVGIVGLVPYACTAEGVAVKVQPSTINERVDTGAVVEGALTVTNQNGGTQTYYIGTRNITNMDESGRPEFAEVSETMNVYEAAAWIKVLHDTITLNVGQSVSVPYRIEVPTDASPGSYFAAIFVTREADKVTQSGAGVGFQVASLVNLRVNGDAVEEVVLREFSSDRSWYQKPEVGFSVRVENTGNVHEKPRGVIEITDMLGNKVGTVVVNERGGGVMPHADRVFNTSWTYERFAFGRYTAVANLEYGDTESRNLVRSLSFWIVPFKEIGIACGSLVMLLLFVALGLRAYVRGELRKAGHTLATDGRARSYMSLGQRLLRVFVWCCALLLALLVVFVMFSA